MTKKMSAVPKSPMSASDTTQNMEKTMKVVRLFLRKSRSSVEAPT